MEKLKPCPFCGHPKSRMLFKMEHCEDEYGRVAVRYRIQRMCNRCGARSGSVLTDPQAIDKDPRCDWAEGYRSAADAKWNGRDGERDAGE